MRTRFANGAFLLRSVCWMIIVIEITACAHVPSESPDRRPSAMSGSSESSPEVPFWNRWEAFLDEEVQPCFYGVMSVVMLLPVVGFDGRPLCEIGRDMVRQQNGTRGK